MSNCRLNWRPLACVGLAVVALCACVQAPRTGAVVPVPGIGATVAPTSAAEPVPVAPEPELWRPPSPPGLPPLPPFPGQSAAKPRPENVWSPRMEYRRVGLAQFTQGRGIEVSRMSDDQLRLRIPSTFAFNDQGAAVSLALQDLLGRLSASIRKDEPVFIAVTSHPDAGGGASLAQARAQAVVDALLAAGATPSRVQARALLPGATLAPDRLDIWVRDAGPTPPSPTPPSP
jgi:hypothetical protein